MISFGLKNIGAIYQWLVNKVFIDHIDQNMEVYIDDMLIKSFKEVDNIKDLGEAFNILHWYQIKLNLSKYTFSITVSKFLGFLIIKQDIEVNVEKI